ncbi:MAG: transcription antitermination factor NusB [Dehalococcoidia bacterium]|nr:transcription antitermination factor NusB [Dehalococcoidia bacterium]
MATTPRRKARVAALQALYEADVAGHPLEECLERQLSERIDDPQAAEMTTELVRGVSANAVAIDETIRKTAPGWKLEQMGAVDRNILRLAVYELLHNNEAPLSPTINDAVELAKTYGGESSGRFVNGVLGAISLTGDPERDALTRIQKRSHSGHSL